jgi:hypothetical protein
LTAYDPGAWENLFVAAAGASAALAGLIFVAVSINLEQVLKFGLADRALQALIQLLAVVLYSLLLLAPGQSNTALGLELVGLSLPAAVVSLWLINRTLRTRGETASPLDPRRIVAFLGTVPFVVGGISLLAETGGGIYWVMAGTILAIMGGVVNAWVLLVEIRR